MSLTLSCATHCVEKIKDENDNVYNDFVHGDQSLKLNKIRA